MSIFDSLAKLLFAVSSRYDTPYETRTERVGYFLLGFAPNVRKNITMKVYVAPAGEWTARFLPAGSSVSDPTLVAQVQNPHTGEMVEMAIRNRFTAPFVVRFMRGRIGSLIV